MAKKYKPGQFCSLGGTLYRVKKRPAMIASCWACGYKCGGGLNDQLSRDCEAKLPGPCYPVEIKPKRQG